jgi:hypothetical protein
MRKARIAIALLIAAIGILFLLWSRRQKEASSALDGGAAAGVTPAAPSTKATNAPSSPGTNENVAAKDQRRAIINAWESAREKEVEFWGKVIDQHDAPIAGVVVTATVTTHQIPPPTFKPQPTTIYSATTGEDGSFYIKGRQGRGFTIETMTRGGYVLPPDLQGRTNNLFWYNYDQLDPKGFKPNADAPVIFRMWKLEKPEKLVQGDGFFGIIPDNSVYTIDLLLKKKLVGATEGDLRVKINRPAGLGVGSRNYDWSCTIEAVEGGLIESNDDFMYAAPAAGYQPAYEVAMQSGNPRWTDTIKQKFYLQSRSGSVFARLEVEIIANYQSKAVFNLKYHANPNGSRNLEFAPTSAIAPPK